MSRKNIIEIIKLIQAGLTQDDYGKSKKRFEDLIKEVEKPITLADFLGWEEGVAYEIFGKKLIIKDDGLWFIREGNLRCSTDISWSKHNITTLRQAKKVKPKKYYAKIKGWEVLEPNHQYFRWYKKLKKITIGNNIRCKGNEEILDHYFTKEEWNELGINDYNADFEEVNR